MPLAFVRPSVHLPPQSETSSLTNARMHEGRDGDSMPPHQQRPSVVASAVGCRLPWPLDRRKKRGGAWRPSFLRTTTLYKYTVASSERAFVFRVRQSKTKTTTLVLLRPTQDSAAAALGPASPYASVHCRSAMSS